MVLHSLTALNIAPCEEHPFSDELSELNLQEDSKHDSEENSSELQEVLSLSRSCSVVSKRREAKISM